MQIKPQTSVANLCCSLNRPLGVRRCYTATLKSGSLAPSNSKGTHLVVNYRQLFICYMLCTNSTINELLLLLSYCVIPAQKNPEEMLSQCLPNIDRGRRRWPNVRRTLCQYSVFVKRWTTVFFNFVPTSQTTLSGHRVNPYTAFSLCFINPLNQCNRMCVLTSRFAGLRCFVSNETNMSNFHPLEVVGRRRETQLQVGLNLNYLI